MTSEERDRRVLALYERMLEIEQRLIPTGLHTFGKPGGEAEAVHLLAMVASFPRPELGLPALTDLIAAGLGLPPMPGCSRRAKPPRSACGSGSRWKA